MGKMSAYRNSKRRERTKQLAIKAGITFDEAMAQIEIRKKRASATLTKIAKSKRKEAKVKKDKKQDNKETLLDKFKTRVTPGNPPVQGGSPGLGKR